MKYKVGDKVIVKDLTKFNPDIQPGIVSDMYIYSNKLMVISYIDDKMLYFEDGEYWSFHPDWVRPAIKEKLINILNR